MPHIGRIKVIQPAEDIMDCVCVCPHCGNHARYGDMFMISGIHGCPKCQTELHKTITFDRENQYDAYVRKANNYEYEPYRYVEESK